MCGIFAFINGQIDPVKNNLIKHIEKNKKRGPEVEKYSFYDEKIFLSFHRLAINGLDPSGDQPLILGKYVIIGNGEIYNYQELIQEYNITPKGKSDIEVLLHLYKLFELDFLKLINGEFSFVLYDGIKNIILIARDQFGIRPLYYNFSKQITINQELNITKSVVNSLFCFSSTLSSLVNMDKMKNNTIKQFDPGHCMILKKHHDNNFYNFNSIQKYIHIPPVINYDYSSLDIHQILYYSLKAAVSRRILTSDRPVGALLSGGLDSSIICALSQEILKENGKSPLHTFSIGLTGSEDLKYSKQVANHIGSYHHQVTLSEEDFLNSIPSVIYDIESYDTTTVRASTGNWLIGKYIKENTDVKVVLNGDGADELMGGYLYFHKAPNDFLFDEECKRLLNNIHYYDVLRSDRSISSHGLEPRTPFLDKDFVNMYLSIEISKRNHTNKLSPMCNNTNIEKYLIRNSIEKLNSTLLPNNILWRQKEAFSDGVSSLEKSWYQVIQDDIQTKMIEDKLLNEEIERTIYPKHLSCETLEQKYYYVLFKRQFQNCEETIPYYWMPRFINATDASARTLKSIYGDKQNIKNVVKNLNV